jgi:hypothetical protein
MAMSADRAMKARAGSIAGVFALTVAAALVPAQGAAAAAAHRSAAQTAAATGACTVANGGNDLDDIDGDGQSDVVVGLLARAASHSTPGGLDVRGSASGAHVVSGAAVPDVHASSAFGAALAQTRVNGDSFSDVVVGDPGHAGGGAVDILFGSAAGLSTSRAIQIAGKTPLDRFGTAVAVQQRELGQGKYETELWVGAPGRAAGGQAGAGAADHYRISPAGVVTFVETISADNPKIPGPAHAHDHLGQVIVSNGGNVAIGAPDADSTGVVDSGDVLLVQESAKTLRVVDASLVGQNSPTVPGGSETGDHFGAALSAGLAGGFEIGVPGEDIGSIVDAGMVQAVNLVGSRLITGPGIGENSAGVPGSAEAGDRFGAALAAAYTGDGQLLWIGAPGESIGATAGAGVVIQSRAAYDEEQGVTTYDYATLYQARAASSAARSRPVTTSDRP